MIACFLHFVRSHGIAAGGFGMIAYGTICFTLMLLLLRFPSGLNPGHLPRAAAYLGRFSYLALPLALGLALSQASHWVDIRLCSSMQAGTISALSYARKLVDVPILVGAFCLGVILLPYFSDFFVKAERVLEQRDVFKVLLHELQPVLRGPKGAVVAGENLLEFVGLVHILHRD